jgi:hypothetical protein
MASASRMEWFASQPGWKKSQFYLYIPICIFTRFARWYICAPKIKIWVFLKGLGIEISA